MARTRLDGGAEAARVALTQQAAKLPNLELRTITVPESGDSGTRLFASIDEMAQHDQFLFFAASLEKLIDQHLAGTPFVLDFSARNYLAMAGTVHSLGWYRRRNIEWSGRHRRRLRGSRRLLSTAPVRH